MADHNHDCTGCGGYWVCDLDDCNLDDVCMDCEELFNAKAANAGLRLDGIASSTQRVLREIADERARQDAKWGVQNHPDGNPPLLSRQRRKQYQEECDRADAEGTVTWRHILDEEWAEALDALDDPEMLREELVQVAGVAVAWIEAIDRRRAP